MPINKFQHFANLTNLVRDNQYDQNNMASCIHHLTCGILKKPKDPYVNRLTRADDITGRNTTQIRGVVDVLSPRDVIETIKKAHREKCSISICGTSHTMGGQTLSKDGYRLNFDKYNRVLKYDQTNDLVTVQSGVLWENLIKFLDPNIKRPCTLQSYCNFTTGGSAGPNCHGVSSDECLITSIESFKIIDAKCNEIICSRTQNYDLFKRAIGSYGLFGVIMELTFRTKQNCMTELITELTNVEKFMSVYEETIDNPEIPIKMARINITNMKEISLYKFVKKDSPITPINPKPNSMSRISQLMYKWIMPYTLRLRYLCEWATKKPIDWSGDVISCNQLLYETSAPLTRLYCPVFYRDDTHILQEFFVPKDKFVEWMHLLEKLELNSYTKNILLNITIRFVKKDDESFLSYARQDSFAFVFYWRSKNNNDADAELEQIHMKLSDSAISLGGSFYLPYRHHYSVTQLLECYPNFYEFIIEKLKYDPNEIFSNNWYRHCQTLLMQSSHHKKQFVTLLQGYDTRNFDTHIKGIDCENEIKHNKTENTFENNFDDDLKFVFSEKRSSGEKTYYFKKLLSDPHEIAEFKVFLDNIFTVFDSDKLISELSKCSNMTDFEIFTVIKGYVEKTKKSSKYETLKYIYNSIKLLISQKRDIADQITEILDISGVNNLNGVGVFGEPGRYINLMKKSKKISNVWVVNDNPKFTDRIETGSIFCKIGVTIGSNDLEKIKSNSLDLVICMIGLHHYDEKYLTYMMEHVNRILRKGGRFMMREHLATDDLMHRPYCAHIIFNAVTNADGEETEYRNFHTIDQWKHKIKSYGFDAMSIYKIQKYDPTYDYLITFIKTEDINILTTYENCLKRDLVNTLYTLPEWYIVQFTKEYGEFMETIPYYMFPYIHCIVTFIKASFEITKKSINMIGLFQTLISIGLIMNLVIGSIFVLQLLFLSFVSIGPRIMYRYVKEDRVLNALVESNEFIEQYAVSEFGIKVLHSKKDMYVLELPRYKPFIRAVKYLIDSGFKIINIAGNDQLQVKIGVPCDSDLIKKNKLGSYDIISSYTFYPKDHEYNKAKNINSVLEVSVMIKLNELKDLFDFVEGNGLTIIHLFDY